MKEERERRIKLFCPSLSKVVQLVTRDDQKLNLGSIAHTFGLQPSTLKLNGHFISRGVDLIASSVTWKSLISFFSSRGLSTGIDGSGILVVDGKLSKPGSKKRWVTLIGGQAGKVSFEKFINNHLNHQCSESSWSLQEDARGVGVCLEKF